MQREELYVLCTTCTRKLYLVANNEWRRARARGGECEDRVGVSEAKTCKIVPRGTTPLGKIKFPERKLVSDREGGREMN